MAEDVNLELSVNIQNAMASLKKVNDALIGIEKSGMEAGKRMDASFQKVSNNARRAGADVGKLKTEFAAPAGMIEKLEAKLNSLYVARKKAFSVADIKAYNAEIKKTEAEMRNLTATAQQSNNVFSQIKNQIAGAFAIGAIVNFARESVKAFAEAERGAKLLKFALNNNEKALATLDKQAQKYKETGLYDDDDITKGQVFLAQQGRTEEQIRKTIDAAVALSVTTGDDLMTSVEKLDATMEGNIGRLGKMDSRFKDLTETQLANGAAIDLVSEKYGKNVEAMADTTDAKLGKLSNMWSDFKEEVGERVVNAYDKLDTKNKDFWTSAGDIATLYGQVLLGPMDDVITKTVEWTVGIKEADVRLRAFTGTVTTAADEISNLARRMKWTEQDDINNLMSLQLNAIEMAKKIKEQTADERNKIAAQQKTAYEKLQEELAKVDLQIKNSILTGGKHTQQLEAEAERIRAQIKLIDEFAAAYEELTKIESKSSEMLIKDNKLVGESFRSLKTDMKEAIDVLITGGATGGASGQQAKQSFWDKLGFDEENTQIIKDSISQIADALSDMFAKQEEMYRKMADVRQQNIENLQRDIGLELQLNEQGFASNVEAKRKQLAEEERMRKMALAEAEKAQRRQAAIEAATQAGAMATSVAQMIKFASTATGPAGAIAAIALGGAVIAQFLAMRMALKSATKYEKGGTDIFGGRRHSEGGNYVDGIGEVERGERWAIFSREATAKHKALPVLIDAINGNDRRKATEAFMSMMGFNSDSTKGIDDGVKSRDFNINSKVTLNEVGELRDIRDILLKQGNKQIYVDKNGNRVEIIGNRKKIYRA